MERSQFPVAEPPGTPRAGDTQRLMWEKRCRLDQLRSMLGHDHAWTKAGQWRMSDPREGWIEYEL